MKSFFTYSRFVFKHPGELPGSTREAIVEKAGKAGEVIGEAYESSTKFLGRIEFLRTSKNALRALRDGFRSKSNPMEKFPSDTEKNKQLLEFVAKQLGCSRRDLNDALYSKFTPPVDRARSTKREEIMQRLVVLQGLLPEMELTFVGVATSEIHEIADHDAAWYLKQKNIFTELLERQIGPPDVAIYINAHMHQIKEYINSANPVAVVKKYPELFLTSNPIKGQRGKYEINGHNLFDLAIAYERARSYSNKLLNAPVVQGSSLDIPSASRFDLFVFDIAQARENGVTMKYEAIRGGQVGASGISDEPASRRAEGGAGSGAAKEKAPDGKEGERVDPIGDLDTFARAHKWKGLQVDPDIHGKRFDPTDIAKYVPNIERVLLDIATKPQYKEFWPLLSEVKITITPRDLRDIFNPYSEGFSWDDETFKITYTKSEETNTKKIVAYLREYMLYKKLGVPEKLDTPRSEKPRDINFVIPWLRYFKSNIEGHPIRPPVSSGDDGKDKPKEKSEEGHNSADKLRVNTIAALAKLSTDTGVKVSLMQEYSDSADAKDDEYEYDDMLKKLPGLTATLNRLKDDEKLEVNKIGVLLTPERNIVRPGMPRLWYSHGLVEQSDGTKKIQIDVKEDALKDIRESIKKNFEYKPDEFLDGMKRAYLNNYSVNLSFEGDDSEKAGIVKEWKNFEKASNEIFRNFADAENEESDWGFFVKKKNAGKTITINIFYGGGIKGNVKGTFKREGYIGDKEMRIDISKDSGTILSDIKQAIKKQKSKDMGWGDWMKDNGREVWNWITS